jgi:replicative DNA helicase
LQFDLARDPDAFAPFVSEHGAGTVVIDSMKDLAAGLTDDTNAANVNRALQQAVASGVEVLVLHHQRKATSDNRKANSLADVYGSMHLTAGAGSVLSLWGDAGDPVVDVTHVKQPAGDVGPFKIVHDHTRGTTEVYDAVDLLELLNRLGELDARTAAAHLYVTKRPSPADVERARRRLTELVRSGVAKEVPGGGAGQKTRYIPTRVT